MCNRLIARLFFFVSFLNTVGFWPGFLFGGREVYFFSFSLIYISCLRMWK